MRHSEKDSLLLSGKRWPEELRTGLSLFVMTTLAWTFPVSAQDPGELQSSDEETYEEEVIVTGLRGTMQSAQDIKYEAETLVDSIVADDIANLPDRSVTETLQRIPGVTIDRFISRGDPEHFSGEGSGVAVRGLTQVRGEINGRDGFTANGGRSLSFEDVPPELLAGVDVYKNQTADMIEGGLGGTVNLRTRMPLDIDGLLVAFTATANHQNFIEETTPGYSVLFSNNWDTPIGEVGALVDLAYSELQGRIDVVFNRPFFPFDNGSGDTVYVPRGADWRTERTYREREGVYGAFQLKPSDDVEYFLTMFRSKYDFEWDEDALFVDNDPYTVVASGDSTYDSDGIFVSGTLTDPSTGGINMGSDFRFAQRVSETTDISAGVKWQMTDNWHLTADLQDVEATNKGLDSTVAAGVLAPFIGIENAGGIPDIRTDVDYMANPANYHFAFTMDHQDDNKAEQTALRIDTTYSFEEMPILKSIKFGVRQAERDSDTINTSYNWRAVIQPWMRGPEAWHQLPEGPLPKINQFDFDGVNGADMVHVNRFDNFFRGDIRVPGSVVAPNRALAENYPDSYSSIHAAAQDFYNPGTVAPFVPTEIQPSHLNVQDETVESVYARLDFGWDDLGLSGNIGVRRVETENIASGFIIPPDVSSRPVQIQAQFPTEDIAIAARSSYTNTLPSLNLRWEVFEGFLTRLGASKAIYRPNFSDMQSYLQLFVNLNDGEDGDQLSEYNGSATGGNPNLKPLEADQLDLSFEWYYSDIGSTWLNLFSKDIDGFIRNQPFIENIAGFDYVITRPANQDKAEIDGWELGLRHFFDFGFGVEASYTHIDSSTTVEQESIPLDTNGTEFDVGSLPYEGLSENSYSLTTMFENELVSARLAYTWREEFLVSIGPNGYNGNNNGIVWRIPVFQDDYGQWDGSVFFNINDQYALGLEANNLTNEELRLLQKQTAPGTNIASSTVQDTRYALTLRAKW